MNFFRFFSDLRNFFSFSYEKTKFGYVLARRLRTTLKKFLDN